jgi:hypothetical protein
VSAFHGLAPSSLLLTGQRSPASVPLSYSRPAVSSGARASSFARCRALPLRQLPAPAEVARPCRALSPVRRRALWQHAPWWGFSTPSFVTALVAQGLSVSPRSGQGIESKSGIVPFGRCPAQHLIRTGQARLRASSSTRVLDDANGVFASSEPSISQPSSIPPSFRVAATFRARRHRFIVAYPRIAMSLLNQKRRTLVAAAEVGTQTIWGKTTL